MVNHYNILPAVVPSPAHIVDWLYQHVNAISSPPTDPSSEVSLTCPQSFENPLYVKLHPSSFVNPLFMARYGHAGMNVSHSSPQTINQLSH